ncbi:MAG TPA: BatA domain-containing protein, partial [Burkholderiales bacterium]|nr:BatA domain-containing protein [Burkholderiales bacterium]
MSFIWPVMFILLLLIPLCAVLYIRMQRRRQRLAANYASFGLGQQAMGRRPGARRHIPMVIFLIGLTILLVAL